MEIILNSQLMHHALCKKYKTPSKINKDLMFDIGSAIQKSLNEGFDKGKEIDSKLIAYSDVLYLDYGVTSKLSDVLIENVNKAIYDAFCDGYNQGKRLSSFIDSTANSDCEWVRTTSDIINNKARADDLLLLNYLTD